MWHLAKGKRGSETRNGTPFRGAGWRLKKEVAKMGSRYRRPSVFLPGDGVERLGFSAPERRNTIGLEFSHQVENASLQIDEVSTL